MQRRARRIAGIFALIAMSSALAETAVASMCAPGMDMADSPAAMGDMAGMTPVDGGAANLPAGSDREDGPKGERDCPFGPATTVQGCAGVASLPARGLNVVAFGPAATATVSIDEAQDDLLLGTTLFHPPRT